MKLNCSSDDLYNKLLWIKKNFDTMSHVIYSDKYGEVISWYGVVIGDNYMDQVENASKSGMREVCMFSLSQDLERQVDLFFKTGTCFTIDYDHNKRLGTADNPEVNSHGAEYTFWLSDDGWVWYTNVETGETGTSTDMAEFSNYVLNDKRERAKIDITITQRELDWLIGAISEGTNPDFVALRDKLKNYANTVR